MENDEEDLKDDETEKEKRMEMKGEDIDKATMWKKIGGSGKICDNYKENFISLNKWSFS